MELDKKSVCEVFQVPSEALKNIEAGLKWEPKIIAGNLNNDELLLWMQNKITASRHLRDSLAERESLQQALVEINARITALTNSAALEVCQAVQDSPVNSMSKEAKLKTPTPAEIGVAASNIAVAAAQTLRELNITPTSEVIIKTLSASAELVDVSQRSYFCRDS